MFHDTETGETVQGGADVLFENLANHLAKRIADANPPTSREAALAGVRMGISFMASMLDSAAHKKDPRLILGVLVGALAQRDAWGLADSCDVQFINMSHTATDTKQ